MKKAKQTIGVVGGSGLYKIPGLDVSGARTISTPYGAPSAPLTEAHLGDTRLLFLPRHGTNHRVPPHEVNYRANICALKMAGAEQVVSISAVGSMQDDIHPGDVVVVDQYIDLTKRRASTYFETGLVAHVSLSHPVCENLATAAAEAAEATGSRVHRGGTYLCIEGPQFSTRAESFLYRSWGVSVIGMTAMPEAKLAREAQLPYATIAYVTDYDCWHDTADAVSVQNVLAVLKENIEKAQQTIRQLSTRLPDPRKSRAANALDHAMITPSNNTDPEVRARLTWLLG